MWFQYLWSAVKWTWYDRETYHDYDGEEFQLTWVILDGGEKGGKKGKGAGYCSIIIWNEAKLELLWSTNLREMVESMIDAQGDMLFLGARNLSFLCLL